MIEIDVRNPEITKKVYQFDDTEDRVWRSAEAPEYVTGLFSDEKIALCYIKDIPHLIKALQMIQADYERENEKWPS